VSRKQALAAGLQRLHEQRLEALVEHLQGVR
jgi:hypothetical protein